MKLATILTDRGPRAALAVPGGLVDLHAADPSLPDSLPGILAAGSECLERVAACAQEAPTLAEDQARFLPVIPSPQKILCVGLNYADHARESGTEVPEEPVIFSKFASALTGHGQPIELPRASAEVDYEAELVVVIGRRGKHVPEDQAMDYVAGYACGHDVSARDWQLRKPGGQWLLGKTFDTFAPVGPYLVTRDEVPDPHQLDIQLRLNGETMQSSNTRELIFSIPRLIAYISQVMTLEVGDLIFTGTPPGVGFSRKPPVFLKPGDVAEVEIQHLGVLRNPVVAEP